MSHYVSVSFVQCHALCMSEINESTMKYLLFSDLFLISFKDISTTRSGFAARSWSLMNNVLFINNCNCAVVI